METLDLPLCFKSRNSDCRKSKNYSFKLNKIIENYFSKKFKFSGRDDYILPDPSKCFVEEKWKVFIKIIKEYLIILLVCLVW